MLPAFPKIEAFCARSNRRVIRRTAATLSPVIAMVRPHVQFEGKSTSIKRYDNTGGESSHTLATGKVSLSRLPLEEFTLDVLAKALTDFATQFAESITHTMYGEMTKTTEAVGNVVDGGGVPLDENILLKALEKMEHSFAPDGSWIAPQVILHPDQINRLTNELKKDPQRVMAFQRSLATLVEKKRDEYRRREADRVLAG